MQNFLGTLLSILGAFWWLGCLLGTLVVGLSVAVMHVQSADFLIHKIVALPALSLLLMIGDGMVIFGLLMVGQDKPMLIQHNWSSPLATNPVLWLILRSMGMAGMTLAGVFACGFVCSILFHSNFGWSSLVLGLISASAAGLAHWWIPRISERPDEPHQ